MFQVRKTLILANSICGIYRASSQTQSSMVNPASAPHDLSIRSNVSKNVIFYIKNGNICWKTRIVRSHVCGIVAHSSIFYMASGFPQNSRLTYIAQVKHSILIFYTFRTHILYISYIQFGAFLSIFSLHLTSMTMPGKNSSKNRVIYWHTTVEGMQQSTFIQSSNPLFYFRLDIFFSKLPYATLRTIKR